MQLTKYTHSCVRVEDSDRRLVVDPGVFSELAAALDDVHAVLITHEHPDHVNVDELRAALERDAQLRVWAPAPVVDALGGGDRLTVSEPGQAFDAGGFAIRTFGGQHAVIHRSIPVIPNVGYLVADTVYHPGDAFVVPPVDVPVLLAPIHAPWSKMAEVIDFAVAVRAPRVVGIHDAGLSEIGRGLVEGQVARIAGEYGVQYLPLRPADSLDL